MKKLAISISLAGLGLALVGCGSSRNPAQYASDTQKAVAEQQAELNTCYENVLKTKPDAKGDVTVQFYWNTSNSEKGVRLPRKALEITTEKQDAEANIVAARTTAPDEVTKCVTAAIAKMRIRPAGDGVGNATWTFKFTPSAAPTAAPAAAPAAKTAS